MELCIDKFRKTPEENRHTPHLPAIATASPSRTGVSTPPFVCSHVRRAPRFAGHDDRRTADLEHRFLFVAPTGLGKRVHLDDAPHRHRANLHETEPTAVRRQCGVLGLSK
jgi:hypothetical protein